MWAWLSRAFRSTGAAERAEAEGRFEEAVRLYVEAADRDDAVRVLLAMVDAGEGPGRRSLLARAVTLATDEAQRAEARRRLALLRIEEAESDPPRTEDARRTLAEAARHLEEAGEAAEAARAWTVLEDREALARALTLAGDVDALERLGGARLDADRYDLRRRAATEDADARWRSGDRSGAVSTLRGWAAEHGDDHEVRRLLDERSRALLRGVVCGVRLDGEPIALATRLPVTLGREGDVVLRGASVSRRHCELARSDSGAVTVRDLGSRAGTSLDGIPIGATMPLSEGRLVELGADLALRVTGAPEAPTLRVERGMERGRRVVVLGATSWETPLGTVRASDDGLVLAPSAPVSLNGQRVAMPILLARGDRVDGDRHALEAD